MGKCATKKPVRRYANGGMLDNPLEAVMPFEPRQPAANPLQNQVNALDQKIAMGNAMDGLSNTERYQLANPGNAAYKPGSMMGGTSADASMQRQQNSILQNLRSGIAAQIPSATQSKWIGGGAETSTPSIGDNLQIGQPRRFADGGVVGMVKRRNQQIEEVANYDSAPAVKAVSAPVKPSAGSQADDYAAQAARIEAEQQATAKALMTPPKKKGFFGFAEGGKISGPGTATSDQIPAQVRESGEPILVSNKERIVSASQESLLQKIAQGIGFKNLDALLESGTGKPVGPTIKGGKLAAANGVKIPDEMTRDQKIALSGHREIYGQPSAARGDRVQDQPVAVTTERQAQPRIDPNRDYSNPDGEGVVARQAIGYVPPRVEQPTPPIDLAKNFSVPDFSMAAADPKGYEKARQQIAPTAPTIQAATKATPSIVPAASGQKTMGVDYATLSDQTARQSIAQPTPSPVAPSIAGTATFRGKSVSLPANSGYQDISGNPTNDWTKTDRYAQAMQVNDRMSKLARQMERDRYGRDMQADITNPKVIALAKLNLDRMNQEDETQQQGIASGLDSRIKQNALAQSDQERQMIDRLNDPLLTTDQRLALRSDLLVMKGKNPNEHRYITRPNTKVYNDMGQIIGEEPGDIFDTAIGGPISGGSGRSQKMPAPKSKAEMDALPKGTRYTAPDGSVRVKP